MARSARAVTGGLLVLGLVGAAVRAALAVAEDCGPEDADCAGDESGLLQHRLASSIRGARAAGGEDPTSVLDDGVSIFSPESSLKEKRHDAEKVNAFFEMCQASDARARRRPAVSKETLIQKQHAQPCDLSTHMVLSLDTAGGVSYSCCPLGAVHCGGCASADDSQCLQCMGGYTLIDGICTACINENWTDYDNNTCAEITTCSDLPVQGVSSYDACCACGGGLQAATPFSYFADTVLLGSQTVLGYPVPRIAVRYSIDPDCQLVSKGITIDGVTGRLMRTTDTSSADGYTPLGTEPWEVSCTLTAHQTPTLNSTTTITIKADFFGYRSYSQRALLVGSNQVASQVTGMSEQINLQNYDYMCNRHNRDRCSFQLQCAAQGVSQWLSIDETYGNLLLGALGPQADSPGISGVDTWNDYVGSPGATCQVVVKSDIWFPGQGTTPVKQLKFQFPLVNPQTWPQMQFSTDQLQATVGQAAPPLYVEPPSSWGDNADYAKPSRFSIACDESPAQASGKKAFAFDTTTGSGTLNDIHFLTVDTSNGAVRFAPPATLASNVLDNLVTTDVRRLLNLTCSVIGHYDLEAGGPNPWVAAPIELDVFDDTCWIPVEVAFLKNSTNYPWEQITTATSEADCRKACRDSALCTHFNYSDAGGCIFPHFRCSGISAECEAVTAQEKVVGCSQRNTCLRVTFEHHWDYSGWYCPKSDMGHLGQVYGRTSVTPKDFVWIAPYQPDRDSSFTQCEEGQWMLRKPDTTKDFIKPEQDLVELNGVVIACLDVGGDISEVTLSAGVVNITIVATPSGANFNPNPYVAIENPTCGSPNITAMMSEAESEAATTEGSSVSVMPIVLDDPTTDTPADHWLHPCSCFSETNWGQVPPVSSESFTDVPQGSGNQFHPKSFPIVQGEYVCEPGAESLLRILILKEDVKPKNFDAYCEQQCRGDGQCLYFYAGSAAETKQCRLYKRCTVLVREAGVAGTLYGLAVRNENNNSAVCRIADPQTCHEVSVRREYLGAGVAATELNPSPASDFLYGDLVEQCDFKLLLGQLGIQKCGLGTYSFQSSTFWSGKSPPAPGAKSGKQLQATCWDERYTAVPSPGAGYAELSSEVQTLTCLTGHWYGPNGQIGLGGFACATCVTVASGNYRSLQSQNRVELYFTPRQELFLYIMTNPPLRLSSTGALVEAPVDFSSSTPPTRPAPPYLYGTLTNTDVSTNVDAGFCVGIQTGRIVDIDASTLAITQTYSHTDPDTTLSSGTPTYQQKAYGAWGAGSANSRDFYSVSTANENYVASGNTVGLQSVSATGSSLNNDMQAMARGIAFANLVGLPQTLGPWDQKAALSFDISININGSEFRSLVSENLGVDFDFGLNTFTGTIAKSVVVKNVSGTEQETIQVVTTVSYTSSVKTKNVAVFMDCNNADSVGWYNGDALSPGPMLRIEGGAYDTKCLTRSAEQYDNSYMLEVADCTETGTVPATQEFGYRSLYTNRLNHGSGSYCVSGVVERSLDVTVRLTPCENDGSGTQVRGVYTYQYYQANWIMAQQDCWATAVSTGCSATCGGGYDTRTVTVLSPNRGIGQSCPVVRVACNLFVCPEGNGGYLPEMFPTAGVGVLQFRSTNGSATDCLSYNASGAEEFAVSTCDSSVVAQQLDSAQVPTMLWDTLRRTVAGGQLIAQTAANVKFPNGNQQKFLSDLRISKSCGTDAVIQELRWGTTSGEPGIQVRCAAGVINSLDEDSITNVEVDYPRSDIIQTKEGGYCLSATTTAPVKSGASDEEKQLAAAGSLAWGEFLKCNPDDANQRFYYKGSVIVNVGTTLCMTAYKGAGYWKLRPCSDTRYYRFMTYDEDGRIYKEFSDGSKYCLGWMKAQTGAYSGATTKVAVNYECLASNQNAKQVKSGKVEPAQQLMRMGSGIIGLGFQKLECDSSTGSVLSSFELTSEKLLYTCVPLGAVGSCQVRETPEVNTLSGDLSKLPLLDFNCTGGALQYITPELSSGGDTLKFKYMCCTLTEPSALVLTGVRYTKDQIPSTSGVYCANQTRDISGRMMYNQRSWFNESSNITNAANTLYFDHLEGEWCLSDGTCAASDVAVPTDTELTATDGSWDAVEVTNFAYAPVPRGVTPAQKKKREFPQLIKFNAVQPEYKEECRDEVTPGEPGFDRDLMSKEFEDLPSENPCSLVGGGTTYRKSPKAFQADGENDKALTSSDVFDCSQRAIDRSGQVYHANFGFDVADMSRELIADSLSLACDPIPEPGLWAGFVTGFYTTVPTSRICSGVVEKGLFAWQTVQFIIKQALMGVWNDNEINDCDPVQSGMARMFCYLHCIRDSARAGNTAVLKSMESAAKVQTANNKLLFEYYFGLISDKLDEAAGSSSAGLLQQEVKQDIERARTDSESLFQEMTDLVANTRLDERGEGAVSRALDRFLREEDLAVQRRQNRSTLSHGELKSELALLSQRAQRLHAVALGAGRLSSKADVERQVYSFVMQHQDLLKLYNKNLGLFKLREKSTKHLQQRLFKAVNVELADVSKQIEAQGIETLMMSLDGTWWKLRSVFDEYLKAVNKHHEHMEHTNSMLQDYTSMCDVPYKRLLQSFHRAHAATETAKKTVKESWRKAIPLVGLLTAKLVDGKALEHFARADLLDIDVAKLLHKEHAFYKNVSSSEELALLERTDLCSSRLSAEAKTAATNVIYKAAFVGSRGLWTATMQQVAIVMAEIQGLGHWHSPLGLGKPPNTHIVEDTLRLLGKSMNGSMDFRQKLSEEALEGYLKGQCQQ